MLNWRRRSIRRCVAFTVCPMALAIAASLATGANDETEETYRLAPAEKLTDYRLLMPRYVYQNKAVFRVYSPPSAEEQLEGGRVTCMVHVRSPHGAHTGEARVAFETPPQRRRARGDEEPMPRSWEGKAVIDMSDWPDGEAEAWLSVEVEPEAREDGQSKRAANTSDKPAAQPKVFGRKPFRVVRKLFDSVAVAHRDELSVWLDDANANRPIWGHVPKWPNIEIALRQTDDPYGGLRRFMLRAYPNPQLRRLQPYTLYVPDSLNLDEPAPLLILLHGSGGDHRNLLADYAAGQRFEKHPMLIANAGAFYHQEFRHMALNDVRHVIDDVASKYNVDRTRIYLQGISLGGRGTLEAAALMPDTFAAICPQGAYGVLGKLFDPPQFTRMDPVALRLASRMDIRTWLPNLRNTPTQIILGYKDKSTPPLHARSVAACLRLAGCDVIERGFDTGHNISMPDYDWASTRKWMLSQRLDPRPQAVQHRTSNLRHGRNRWVAIHALHDYSQIGAVRAVRVDRMNALLVDTDNVAAVTLTPSFDYGALLVNRQHRLPRPKEATFTLTFDENDRPSVSPKPFTVDPDSKTKRPGQSGPIWDVWSGPVLYVHATGHGERIDRLLKQSAEASARWDIAWGDRSLPIVAESALTDELRAANTLIWFKPLQHAETETEKKQADEPRGDIRLTLRPSPFSTRGYILSVELATDQPFNLHRLGHWDHAFHVDWLEAQSVEFRGRIAGARIIRCGMFSHDWSPGATLEDDYRIGLTELLHMERE